MLIYQSDSSVFLSFFSFTFPVSCGISLGSLVLLSFRDFFTVELSFGNVSGDLGGVLCATGDNKGDGDNGDVGDLGRTNDCGITVLDGEGDLVETWGRSFDMSRSFKVSTGSKDPEEFMDIRTAETIASVDIALCRGVTRLLIC